VFRIKAVFRIRTVSRASTLSRISNRDRTSPRRTLTLAGSALATAAVSVGAIAASPIGPALMAADSGPAASVAGGPAVVRDVTGAGLGPRGRIVLDAFTQPLLAAGTGAVRPARRLTPRQIAWFMLKSYGWTTREYSSLSSLWARESGWNPYARNSYSGAYGIPQAMPGGKMASAGGDWRTNPRTQIRWGLHYIKVVYGSPSRAWRHEVSYGWY
jgi:Transglycosylase SLT domain